jgi:hypothetical protein
MLRHNPGIFIGLGGAGVKSLARLKAKMYALYKESDTLAKFDEHSFIFIDTDIHDIQHLNRSNDLLTIMDGNLPIHHSELIDLGRTVPQAVRKNMMQYARPDGEIEHFFSWMITENDNPKFRLIDHSLSNGAGASRIDSRVGLYDNLDIIMYALERAVVKNKNLTSNEELINIHDNSNLWIVTGTSGGTGSGIALDILFILDRLWQKYFHSEPFKKLALIAPEPFVNMGGETSFALNSLAFMWELNALKMNRNKESLMSKLFFSDFFDNDDANNKRPFDPYVYALMFDAENNSGCHIDLGSVYDCLADSLLFISCTEEGLGVNSNIINQVTDQNYMSNPSEKSESVMGNVEWSKSIVSFGISSYSISQLDCSLDLGAELAKIQPYFPSNSQANGVNYIYSVSEEHVNMAISLGYNDLDLHHRIIGNNNANSINVVAFEAGYSFDEYRYFPNYICKYEEQRDEILKYDRVCHIDKRFVNLDIDKLIVKTL